MDRLYAPIWAQLKERGEVSITANRALHPRIIKAVTKETWLDIVYKLQISPQHATLRHMRKGSVITFRLTKHLAKGIYINPQDI